MVNWNYCYLNQSQHRHHHLQQKKIFSLGGAHLQLTILILLLICLSLAIILILRQWNLRKMNRQLQKIINQFGTNEQLRNNLPGKELNSFVANVNHLISLFKKEEQHTIRQNIEFRQEITNVSHDIRTPLYFYKGIF